MKIHEHMEEFTSTLTQLAGHMHNLHLPALIILTGPLSPDIDPVIVHCTDLPFAGLSLTLPPDMKTDPPTLKNVPLPK